MQNNDNGYTIEVRIRLTVEHEGREHFIGEYAPAADTLYLYYRGSCRAFDLGALRREAQAENVSIT